MPSYAVFWRIDVEDVASPVAAARKAAESLAAFDPSLPCGANVLEVCVSDGAARKALDRASSGATTIDLGNWAD